jgi:hypothetical protein
MMPLPHVPMIEQCRFEYPFKARLVTCRHPEFPVTGEGRNRVQAYQDMLEQWHAEVSTKLTGTEPDQFCMLIDDALERAKEFYHQISLNY